MGLPIPDAPSCIGSPPYEDSLTGDNPEVRGGLFRDPRRAADKSLSANYNVDPAAITSAPYEAQTGGHGEASRKGMIGETGVMARHAASNSGAKHGAGYAENKDGQIGTMKKESYANACRDVYRSMYLLGVRYVALVTKNPIRKQQLKRLDLLTIRLMAEAGYTLRARRRAYLWQTVNELQARGADFPQPEKPQCNQDRKYWENWGERPVGNISFFHINHMAHGLIPPAQWEDVLFFEREG